MMASDLHLHPASPSGACRVGRRPRAPQALTDAFRAELRKFDRERALPAWDGLVTKQQAALEGWGVPAMFITAHAPDREVSAGSRAPSSV